MSHKIHGYPKIWQISHREASVIFMDEVEITEKVDGSQLSICVLDGKLHMRSKGQQINIDAPDNLFVKAVEMAKSKINDFNDGWTYRGEYVRAKKHNTIVYDRHPENYFILFNIDKGTEHYLTYEEMTNEASRIGFEVVPLLYRGKLDITKAKELMDKESILGGAKIEGIVIKNYNRYTEVGGGSKTLMAKIVRESFKEANGRNWKPTNKNEIQQQIADSLKTDARYDKAIQHAKENGLLNGELSDIPVIFKEIHNDIMSEETEYIKDMLFKWGIKDIIKRVSRSVPQYYKEYLEKENFKSD